MFDTYHGDSPCENYDIFCRDREGRYCPLMVYDKVFNDPSYCGFVDKYWDMLNLLDGNDAP